MVSLLVEDKLPFTPVPVSIEVFDNLGQAIGYAVDKAIIYGTGTFKNAAVTLGTTSLPAAAASTMFGQTIEKLSMSM